MDTAGTVRLAKLIAQRGHASRREAERWIEEGEVIVNGTVIYNPAHHVHPDKAHIVVQGETLRPPAPPVYYLFYKPKGVITSRKDPSGRKSVYDLLPELPARVEAVGRLDFNTEGVLLFTNDGPLAHRLTHPSSKVPKRYIAKVWRVPSPSSLERLRKGKIYLDDGRIQPCRARLLEHPDTRNSWIEITVTEGRNRLIRRVMEALGHPVSKLRRESFATLSCRGMERGQLRALSGEEVQRLRDISAGVAPRQAGKKRGKGFAKPKINKRAQGRSRHKSKSKRSRNLKT